MLNVSRPTWSNCLNQVPALPQGWQASAGSVSDLMAYKAIQEERSASAMEELAALAQAQQLGYE